MTDRAKVGAVAYLALLTLALVIIGIQEARIASKIGPEVQVVGPCRTFGPNHPECIRQANLIAEACIKHPRNAVCRLYSRRYKKATERDSENAISGGGGSSSSAPPSSQPTPPSSGGGGSPNPPSRPPGLLGPVTDQVCRLGVCL